MLLPRLIPLDPVPVPAGQVVAGATGLSVMSHAKELKSIPRLCATWIAATHWPRFLKFWQACCGVVPVGSSFARLPESFVFWLRSWSGALAPPFVELASPDPGWDEAAPWLAPVADAPGVAPGRPRCAYAGAALIEIVATRDATIRIEFFILLLLKYRGLGCVHKGFWQLSGQTELHLSACVSVTYGISLFEKLGAFNTQLGRINSDLRK